MCVRGPQLTGVPMWTMLSDLDKMGLMRDGERGRAHRMMPSITSVMCAKKPLAIECTCPSEATVSFYLFIAETGG